MVVLAAVVVTAEVVTVEVVTVEVVMVEVMMVKCQSLYYMYDMTNDHVISCHDVY